MVAIFSSKTLVTTYNITQHNNSKDCNQHLHHREIIRSYYQRTAMLHTLYFTVPIIRKAEKYVVYNKYFRLKFQINVFNFFPNFDSIMSSYARVGKQNNSFLRKWSSYLGMLNNLMNLVLIHVLCIHMS